MLDNYELEFAKETWEKVKFGDIAFEPKETVKDLSSKGIEHIVGLEHIEPDNIRLTRSKGIEKTTFTKFFQEKDVLFGRRRAYLRKACISDREGVCSGDITVMRASDKVLPELLPFFVNNDYFFEHAIKHSAGGLSPRVKFKDLANFELWLPPIEQQRKISALLWSLEDLISSLKMTRSKLERYTYIKSVSYFNNGVETSRPNDIKLPAGWKLQEVKEIVPDIEYGISISIPKNEDDNGVPILSTAEIDLDGKLDYDIVRSINYSKRLVPRLILKTGDVIFNWRNSAELIGKSAIFIQPESDSRDYTFASFLLRMRCDEKQANNHYFSLLFNYYREVGVFLGMARKAVNQANFNKTEVYELLVPVPPYEEQVRIAKELNELKLAKRLIEEQVRKTVELRNCILNRIFD